MAFDAAQFLRNPIRFDRMDTMTPSVMDMPAASRAAETGRLAGAAVTVVADASADLTDSLEELAMQFEEKSAKKLADRKLGETRSRPSAYIEAVMNWMKTMPDMPGRGEIEKLLALMRNMAASSTPPDVAQLKGMLAALSKDPSHQFAVLDIIDAALGSDEASLKDLVAAARSSLLGEKGGEIRAGINLAAEVNARATTPEEMTSLRDLYRSEILGFRSPQDCFRSVLSSRGPGGLEPALEFLTKGCGADLASSVPSMDAVALRRIMQDLQCVQVLKTVLDTMNALGVRMERHFGETIALTGEAMTGRIVDFTEKSFVSSAAFAAFVAECGIKKLLARMDFSREMLFVIRRLSQRLFSTEDDRARLLDAAQEYLDGVIAEEIDPDDGEGGAQ